MIKLTKDLKKFSKELAFLDSKRPNNFSTPRDELVQLLQKEETKCFNEIQRQMKDKNYKSDFEPTYKVLEKKLNDKEREILLDKSQSAKPKEKDLFER